MEGFASKEEVIADIASMDIQDAEDISDDELPKTGLALAIYYLSFERGQAILARITMMLACCVAGNVMVRAREAIKNRRMEHLHRLCANILSVDRVSEANRKLLRLYEKHIPTSGGMNSDEYRRLLDGIDVVPNPWEPIETEGLCRSCRNLNLRKESFQARSSRFVSSITGELDPDGEYTDKELERTVPAEFPSDPQPLEIFKLRPLQEIAKETGCCLCRLISDCFLRLSEEELIKHGWESSLECWCLDGTIWITLLYDPVGDHPIYSSSKYEKHLEPEIDLEADESAGRVRILLSLLPPDEELDDQSFEPPFDILHTEIMPFSDTDQDFHVCKWSMPLIDIARPRKWLHACEEYHGKTCSAPANYANMEVHEDMLLIDLEENCLVLGFLGRRYFALSYVWGKSQRESFLTTKATIEDLMKPGGLTEFLGDIARTILGAMEFTRDMDCRYLWVDALCIVQDDEESKPFQLNHMDAIYRQAVVTIVAGDNLSADSGICGLGERPRENMQRVYKYRPDLKLTASEAFVGDEEVKTMQSNWATRAWTYQERIFSRRLLIFVNSTVYWSCSCLRWSETEPNPSQDGPPPWKYYHHPIFRDNPTLYLKGPQLTGDNSILFVWQNVVLAFTDLNLTFEHDALIAIAGLENYIAQYFDTSFIFGHPKLNFVDFLLWLPIKPDIRRRNAPGIPTWSWAAWVGSIVYVEMRPHQKKHKSIEVKTPVWDTDSVSRVSISCTHSGIIDVHTMVSKIHIVGGGFDSRCLPKRIPEIGSYIFGGRAIGILDKTGKYVGTGTLERDKHVDGILDAIVISKKRLDIIDNPVEVLSYWVMIVEWKGDIAERIGLGVMTAKAWNETNPVWKDIKLG